MTEGMTEEAKQKSGNRTMLITLGVVCIVLSASLVTALTLYWSASDSNSQMKSEIAEQTGIINSQNSTIISQQQQIAALQSSLQQASTKDEDIAALQDYVSQLLNVLYMNASTTLMLNQSVQMPSNGSASIWSDYITYAGYITVEAQSSSNTTYAQVVYSAYGVDYEEAKLLGTGGVASFPVLPASVVEIRLGNAEPSGSVDATVTVVYHF